MNRRKFLRTSLVTTFSSMAMLGGLPGRHFIPLANATTHKTLIVIFQRGGCDALNTCVPYGDENYYSLRPQIAIAPPDINHKESAIDLNGFFGLHPGLAPLKTIFDNSDLAVLPAVHYPQGTHSHFDGQHFIENAAQDKSLDGWLSRHLQLVTQQAQMRAIGFGDRLPHSLQGSDKVSFFRELDEFDYALRADNEMAIEDDLRVIYQTVTNTNKTYDRWLQTAGQTMIKDVSLISQLDYPNYVPEMNAAYPDTRYGRQLKQVSQLIKSNLGLEIATVDLDGWDTHVDQGGGNASGKQYQLHNELSAGIRALYDDLGQRMNDVVIMTCTEFGRTAKQNASGGTDHGNAATWFVIGKSIRGGIYGEWPGLAADQLLHGRYLDFSIDYRDIMGDILTRHLGNNNLNIMLPGHQYKTIGLFA